MKTKRVGVIIPTCQAGEDFELLLKDLAKQTALKNTAAKCVAGTGANTKTRVYT